MQSLVYGICIPWQRNRTSRQCALHLDSNLRPAANSKTTIRYTDAFKLLLIQAPLLLNSSIRSGQYVPANSTAHPKQVGTLPQTPLNPHTKVKGKFHHNSLFPQFLRIQSRLLQSRRPLPGLQCYMIFRALRTCRLRPFHCRRSRPLASLHHSTYPTHLCQHLPHQIWRDVF